MRERTTLQTLTNATVRWPEPTRYSVGAHNCHGTAVYFVFVFVVFLFVLAHRCLVLI